MEGFDIVDARCDVKNCHYKKVLINFGNKQIFCVKHSDKALNKLKSKG